MSAAAYESGWYCFASEWYFFFKSDLSTYLGRLSRVKSAAIYGGICRSCGWRLSLLKLPSSLLSWSCDFSCCFLNLYSYSKDLKSKSGLLPSDIPLRAKLVLLINSLVDLIVIIVIINKYARFQKEQDKAKRR